MKDSFDTVVVHYDEIGLKGKNRGYFERLLMTNIQIKLGKLVSSCTKESGQLTLHMAKAAKSSEITEILTKVPGVAFFSFAEQCNLEVDEVKKTVVELARAEKFSTFKIDTQRHDKAIQLRSMELNSIVGEHVVKTFKKKVQLKNPDLCIKVELSNRYAYVSTADVKGVGGLPTDSRQKVVALLSGGFDSPVAAYLMMKRGCEVILVHFQASGSVGNKINRLAKQLAHYQIQTKLYLIPFEGIQKEIIMKVKSALRMLAYRRFMIKIASSIAELEKARFLVVGDSLAQVASQTFENLEATYDNSGKHILSPLIGMDKKEIIAIARQIGTYDISTLPYVDCCTYFLPKHPELKGSKKLVEEIETQFDFGPLIEDVVKKANTREY